MCGNRRRLWLISLKTTMATKRGQERCATFSSFTTFPFVVLWLASSPIRTSRPTASGVTNSKSGGGGWRSGPSSSGRRWNAPPNTEGGRGGQGGGGNGGWRTVSGDRDQYHNGSSSRWHRESNDDNYGSGRRGGGAASARVAEAQWTAVGQRCHRCLRLLMRIF